MEKNRKENKEERSEKLGKIINNKIFTLLTTSALIVVYIFFIANHLKAIVVGDINIITVLFLGMESIAIFLLFIRKEPRKKSSSLNAWFFAFIGTFLPLIYSPSSVVSINQGAGTVLLIIGSLLAIWAYLSLNNSFGVSPSLREIKTKGLYRFVRHPIYSSYFVLHSGYILLNFSAYNLSIMLVMLFSLLVRAHYEEKILRKDQKYLEFSEKTKYKILPFIY